MKVNGYEIIETSEGLIMQLPKISYRPNPRWILWIAIIILALSSIVTGRLRLEKISLESVLISLAYCLIICGFDYIPRRPWHQKKSVRVSREERVIYLDDQKILFEDIRAITTERAWWHHDVVIYTKDKTIIIFPRVTQYEGTRLCELICMRLPEKESLRLMPWGVSLWADSQRQTPTQ